MAARAAKSDQGLRNGILLACLIFMVAVLGIKGVGNRRLDKAYRADYNAYKKAAQLGPSTAESGKIFGELMAKYPDSHVLVWNYGLHLGATGKYSEAVAHYAKALDMNVFLSQNGRFLMEYGLWLYNVQDYGRSKTFLKASLGFSLAEGAQKQAQEVLADIEKRGL